VKTHVLAVLLLALLGSAEATWAQNIGAAAGAIEGRVELPDSTPRKHAPRYPGADAAHGELQPLPPVVWLTGEFGTPAVAEPDTVVVGQRDKLFVPGALAVRTGTVVRFPNNDPFYHNVFSYSGPRFDLGRYAPGTSREVRLDEPGVVEVYCEIHGSMRAVVVVTDHEYAAVANDDGTFRIEDVPPGTYTLRSYHPDHGSAEVSVSVTAGSNVRVTTVLGE